MMTANIKGVAIFDLSLTPENARKRGFKYIDDIIYDIFALNNSLSDILKLIHTNGYKLGVPSRRNNFTPFYGLYAPEDKSSTETTLTL
jgi:hypothetical protein